MLELRELFCLRNQAVVYFSSFFDSFGDAYWDDLQFNLLHFKSKTKRNEMKPQKYTAAKIRNDPTMRSHDPRDLFEIVVKKVISITQLMFVKLQKKRETIRGVWI